MPLLLRCRCSVLVAICISISLISTAHAQNDLADRLKDVTFKFYAKAPGYTEGPTWRDGEVFFCSGSLMHVAKDGRVTRYFSIGPAGTVLRADRHLLIADNKHKALLDLAPDGKLDVLADACDGEPLASLNDLTLDARGNVYWTDPHGSSKDKPVGKIFRMTPDGKVTQIGGGLAFPNGLDVDPASKYLYVIESQSKKVLRYALPADGAPLGKAEDFYDLGGSGGDGCAFDAAGNLWVADYHRPDTKQGRILVLSSEAKLLATLNVPARVISNLCFGGPEHDEIFCTTGEPNGVYHAKVGIKGFKGHPGVAGKSLRTIPSAPGDSVSSVYPRKFGVSGGVGQVRGWYVWRKYDPATRIAEVTKDPPGGETYTVRVLPWTTTYRHLTYGASVDDLKPGERVNLFFNADENHPRGYLVSYQDEICQMKGHAHIWEIVKADTPTTFTARVLAGGKPFDDKIVPFTLAAKCEALRDGKPSTAEVKPGERLYFTWCWEEDKRVVRLLADDASLDVIKKRHQEKVAADLAQNGIAGWIDGIDDGKVRFMAFSTHWAQAGQMKPGHAVRLMKAGKELRPEGKSVDAKLLSAKNQGTYGSGVNDMVLELAQPEDAKMLRAWEGGHVVRLIPR